MTMFKRFILMTLTTAVLNACGDKNAKATGSGCVKIDNGHCKKTPKLR